jgi:hypothetical protein
MIRMQAKCISYLEMTGNTGSHFFNPENFQKKYAGYY